MKETTKKPVTVLGLGDMGAALANALLENGHPVTVWNRSQAKADPLVAKGAARGSTVADAISASPLVLVCLLDHASVHAVLDPAADGLAGRVLVNVTSGSPDEARELAGWAAGQNVKGFLDGGIMAIPSMIGGPGALVLYSGSRAAFEAHEETLGAMGAATFVGDDAGLAPLLDLAMLAGMYGMFGGFLQAMAFIGTERVEPEEFTTSLLIPWLQAMTGALPEMARQIAAGDYSSTGSSLAMQTSGVGFVAFSESLGVSGELMAPLERLMKQRVADGHGDDDLSSVVELIAKPSDR
ncbi:NAD(P)-dependent oxidoreductase [Phytoactinopolyspora mesophila]|uniref:NAD(P)-dependent oxidoreductase n=1 Tax=Phytoactinopolyspora mesophila TaxID=2650750 RepID=A0A7K3M0F8_9ACTN|nr:NAD(P)-binding domain-containing protein [Phytoactinopolyspora mesophila]NDL55938.1 NAD(P)-dependent oxidoreductase [Phytoactinopolyspora mesophila]